VNNAWPGTTPSKSEHTTPVQRRRRRRSHDDPKRRARRRQGSERRPRQHPTWAARRRWSLARGDRPPRTTDSQQGRRARSKSAPQFASRVALAPNHRVRPILAKAPRTLRSRGSVARDLRRAADSGTLPANEARAPAPSSFRERRARPTFTRGPSARRPPERPRSRPA
jgi:hypothetical protein